MNEPDQKKSQRKFDAIVCLSAIDWNFLWQRTQEVMTQFAGMGYPVLFIENTGVRTPGIKDASRLGNRLKKFILPDKKSASRRKNDISTDNSDIEIMSPLALPFPYFWPAVKWNSSLITARITEFSQKRGIPLNRILLWSYMTTPLAVDIARKIPWAGVLVDLVSDPCKVEGAESILKFHKEMLELANIILCASIPTMKVVKQYVKESLYDKIHLFEDGFSTKLLSEAQDNCEGFRLPEWIGDTPVVAYIGGINLKIWWDAVSAMAAGFPDIAFVFIGPKDFNELPCKGWGKNVTWRPAFDDYFQLGCFLHKSSVGLVPYVPSPYTAEMRPAKINEYLVMGLPIVATNMPELERFERECGPGIMYLADNPADFVLKLKQAIEEDCEAYRKKRREIACSRSWEKVCGELEVQLHEMF